MKHKTRLKIRVSKTVDPDSDASIKSGSLPKRVWNKLSGGTQKVTIIVPGDNVEQIGIYEIPKGGEAK